MIDYSLDPTWWLVYRMRHPQEPRWLTYSREFEVLKEPDNPTGPDVREDISTARKRWDRLASELNIASHESVMVVGAGFGFLAEAGRDAGWNVEASDDSPWIHDRLDGNANVPIIRAGGHRPQDFPARRFDWVLTEYTVSGFSEWDGDRFVPAPELGPFLDGVEALRKPGGTVAHIVQVASPPPFLAFDLEEAKALRPAHTWVSGQHSRWGVL